MSDEPHIVDPDDLDPLTAARLRAMGSGMAPSSCDRCDAALVAPVRFIQMDAETLEAVCDQCLAREEKANDAT